MKNIINTHTPHINSKSTLVTPFFNTGISISQSLESIDPQAVGDKRFLRHVSLVDNDLMTLSDQALPWERLASLNLSSNPWYCDFNIAWMISAVAILDEV